MNLANKWLIFSVIVVLFAIAILITPQEHSKIIPEIENIKNITNIEEQGAELKKLLERVGPLEAQEAMLKSGLPFTGQTHLLIHVVGNYIYEKYGPEGLPLCREYFLSACYHGFIINTLADYGIEGMVDAMGRCREAEPGVFAQCAHAAGHGFTAWHDYDLTKSLVMCDTLGAQAGDFPYFNCYDGVFMENVWGVHGGKPSENRWVKEGNIYYPCNDKRLPEKYLNGCWSNQATLIYQYYKGDLKKTAKACDTVENKTYQETCYNNFSRQIHPLTEGGVEKVFSLCANATGKYWQDYCVLTNVSAYWSVGDRAVSYKICDNISDTTVQNSCFDKLSGMIRFSYSASPRETEVYCDKLSSIKHREQCKK